MNPITSLHATPKAWLLSSVLAAHAEAFATRLERSRYSANTASTYLGSIADLARWMAHCGLQVQLLDENAIELSRQTPATMRLSQTGGTCSGGSARRVQPPSAYASRSGCHPKAAGTN